MSGAEFVPLAISLCEMAVKKGVEQYKKKKLSEAEKELLKTASKNGEIYILSVDGAPDWVRIEKENYCDVNDPAFTIKYLDAFKNLCERGYIYHDGGILFRLTSAGFEIARKLSAKDK